MGEATPREGRFSTPARGVAIGVIAAVYAWVTHQPHGSFTAAWLWAGGLQLAVIAIRKLVPPDYQPDAMSLFEMVADGLTVLSFALGVYGGIARAPADF